MKNLRATRPTALLGLGIAAFCTLAVMAAGADAATVKHARASGRDWSKTEIANPDGTITVGRPDAPVKMTEYVSYTCPHCAEFHKESTEALRDTAIPNGQIRVTVSSLLRNPVDLSISLLVACGDPKQMWMRHNTFMNTQETWMAKTKTFTRESEQHWFTGTIPQRMEAIAADFGFYDTVKAWGVSHDQADQCLSDKAELDKLMALQKKATAIGVPGTPSFVIDGTLVAEHDWPSLSKDLMARITAHHEGMS